MSVDVAAVADVPEGGTLRVMLEETPVCLINLGGSVTALHDTCTHARASLAEGYVDEGTIESPRHGARFDCASGEALTPPASTPQPSFAVTIENGRVHLDPTPSHPHPFDS